MKELLVTFGVIAPLLIATLAFAGIGHFWSDYTAVWIVRVCFVWGLLMVVYALDNLVKVFNGRVE